MKIKRIKTVSRKDIYMSLLGRWKQMVFYQYAWINLPPAIDLSAIDMTIHVE